MSKIVDFFNRVSHVLNSCKMKIGGKMVKFKKEKILFFKKEVKTLCSCARSSDNPWTDINPRPPITPPAPFPPFPTPPRPF